jgi:hypothetical protein
LKKAIAMMQLLVSGYSLHETYQALTHMDLLQVSFKSVLISPTGFMGIPNSMQILYNTSLLNESQAFLMSVNSSRTTN